MSESRREAARVVIKNVRDAFEKDLGTLKISSGVLLLASFRFYLEYEDQRPTTVTFEIEPPSKTDLTKSRHREVIEKYLVKQKVKL